MRVNVQQAADCGTAHTSDQLLPGPWCCGCSLCEERYMLLNGCIICNVYFNTHSVSNAALDSWFHLQRGLIVMTGH